MILIKSDFNLNSTWQELIVSVTVGTAALFAILGGYLNDWRGRRPVVIISSIFFTIGSILLAVAPSKEVLLIGRAVVGMGIGLASMTIPMFISEVAPVELRGRLTTVNVAFITGGQFTEANLRKKLPGKSIIDFRFDFRQFFPQISLCAVYFSLY